MLFRSSLEAVTKAFVHYKEATFLPNPKNVARYEQIYQIWKEAYQTTAGLSHQLVEFNDEG